MNDTIRQDATADTGGATGYLTIDLAALARNYERLAAEVAPARAKRARGVDAPQYHTRLGDRGL